MRVLAIFLIFCVALAVAHPNWGKSRASSDEEEDSDESTYGKNLVATRRSSNSGPGPYYFLKSPGNNENQFVRPRGGPAYRVLRGGKVTLPRDDSEDSDEEDDADDDVTVEDEAEDDEFNTPSWDYLFPKKQQGSYGQGQSSGGPSPSLGGGGGNYPQADQGSYSLAQGSPGGPQYASQQLHQQSGGFRRGHFHGGPPSISRARSSQGVSYDRNVRPVTLRVVRPRQYQRAPVVRRNGQQNWVVSSPPRSQRRQYYGNRHPQSYSYAQSSPRVSYKPMMMRPMSHNKVQYVYSPVPQSFRRSDNKNVWGRQRVSRPVSYRPAYRSVEEYDD